MNTYKAVKSAGLMSIAVALLVPSISMAEADQASASSSHNLVHRVSHSIADSKSYTRSGSAGYKWGKTAQPTESSAKWADNTPARSGYKWGNTASTAKSEAPAYAGASDYQWGSMSFSEQSVYRWGLRSFADQSVYRWGLRSFADQSVYRWGLRSFADQSVYRWGLRSFADQSVYRWGLRSYADQSVYRWGLR